MEDNAGIQENDIKYENKRRAQEGPALFKTIVYNWWCIWKLRIVL